MIDLLTCKSNLKTIYFFNKNELKYIFLFKNKKEEFKHRKNFVNVLSSLRFNNSS